MIRTVASLTAAAVLCAFTSVLAQVPEQAPAPMAPPEAPAPEVVAPATAPAPSMEAPKGEGAKKKQGKKKKSIAKEARAESTGKMVSIRAMESTKIGRSMGKRTSTRRINR